ncbi:hypothetical protein [Paenibacillus sp. RC67]|uniref:hypothetical protein n=1 Tax=Paenibacillus sp. RC67 TaxID=3039392 RepID=UPI0024AE1E3E|nr:hypothetical protein [Paenibacillus sp. RC67]
MRAQQAVDVGSCEGTQPTVSRKSIWKDMKRRPFLYGLLIPVIFYFIVFKYFPLYGEIIAFKEFRLADGIWEQMGGAGAFQQASSQQRPREDHSQYAIPGIRSTVALMLVLQMGRIFDVGFEHVWVLTNPMVTSVSDVMNTYIYRLGLVNLQYSYTTAIGLFQSLVGLVLVLSVNLIIRAMGERVLW